MPRLILGNEHLISPRQVNDVMISRIDNEAPGGFAAATSVLAAPMPVIQSINPVKLVKTRGMKRQLV